MKYFVFIAIFLQFFLLGGLGIHYTYAALEGGDTTGSGLGGDTTGSGLGGDTTGSGLNRGSIIIPNPIKADNIQELFQILLDIVLVFAVPIVVFFIIYAGFLYVTAQGSEDKIKQAHAALLYALIGGLLILGASVLIDIVQGTVDSITN